MPSIADVVAGQAAARGVLESRRADQHRVVDRPLVDTGRPSAWQGAGVARPRFTDWMCAACGTAAPVW